MALLLTYCRAEAVVPLNSLKSANNGMTQLGLGREP